MNAIIFHEKLNNAFEEHIGITLSDRQVECFYLFMNHLIKKNKVMNLTAITEPEEIIMRHFVDSCMPLKFYDEISSDENNSKNDGSLHSSDSKQATAINDRNVFFNAPKFFFAKKKIVDIGTGAGFPGLPLAIVCEDADFTLTDSLGKRINFLQEVIEKISISNTRLVKSRAEDFCAQKTYRENFDFVFSRGVARLSVLSEYCLPALSISGKMISFKMNDIHQELTESENAIKILGGMFHVKLSYTLFSDEPKRALIVIKKSFRTPKVFPRKAGTPSKNPL